MAEDKSKGEKKKQKRPSALKRKLQSDKRKLNNRSYKSSMLTAIRTLEGAIAKKSGPEEIQEKLKKIYSIVDKGVKRGVLKPRKAARTKSRLTSKSAQA